MIRCVCVGGGGEKILYKDGKRKEQICLNFVLSVMEMHVGGRGCVCVWVGVGGGATEGFV